VPIEIPDLWALAFGNGHAGGNAQTLFFAAGVERDRMPMAGSGRFFMATEPKSPRKASFS